MNGHLKVLFAGGKERGAECLKTVAHLGHPVVGVIVSPNGNSPSLLQGIARELSVPVFEEDHVNDPAFLERLRLLQPDVSVLAGFGRIVGRPFTCLAPRGCINLHAGKLPEYRGSSPMNWALINGEDEFAVSVIQVEQGIDTGDVLAESTIPISEDESIADLHRKANRAFPELLGTVLRQMEGGTLTRRRQDEARARYFPLRFPDDGLVLWDTLTARQVHNRVRALAPPYPCAFTYCLGRRVNLVRTNLEPAPFFGEPGRIYRKKRQGLLVCASDRCLWIREAFFQDTGEDLLPAVQCYEQLATVKQSILNHLRMEFQT